MDEQREISLTPAGKSLCAEVSWENSRVFVVQNKFPVCGLCKHAPHGVSYLKPSVGFACAALFGM